MSTQTNYFFSKAAASQAIYRVSIASIGSAAATGLLLVMMSVLVDRNSNLQLTHSKTYFVDFLPRIVEKPPKKIERKKAEKPPELPPVTKIDISMPLDVSFQPTTSLPKPTIRKMNLDHSISGFFVGQPILVRRARPKYPSIAKKAGIEGYVTVEFTIAKNGSILEPKVIDADPAGYFEEEALAAIIRLRYKPPMINDKAVTVPGVRYTIAFRMNN